MKSLIITFFALTLVLFGLSHISWSADLTGNTNSTDLDGINQSWQRADNDDLSLGASTTIAMWVNADTPGSTASFDFVVKYNAVGDNRSFRFEYQTEGAFRGFLWGTSSDGVGGASVKTAVWDYILATTTWTHIAVSNATDGTVKAYANGVLLTQSSGGAGNTTIFNGTDDFQIGDGFNGPFNGRIDDVRVWKRTLTDTQVADLFNIPCTDNNGANLSGWWLFDGNGNDNSGKGFTLTANNGVVATDTSVPYSCGGGVPSIIGDIIMWFE